ncbi:MAG: endonuclease III [Clostridiales bacterium]|nr:endonuclease III [Clostridiales bacterium]
MTKKERVSLLLELMDNAYPTVKCSLDYSNPLEMLIATQLSAQCTDARVNIVTKGLFERYKTAEDYANADIEELQEYIRSAGFYKNKSKNIIECCKRICEVYGGEVPDTMEDLLTLAGTGRKTANLVLGDIFGKSAVVVDTHCIRLTNRIGLVKTKDPVKIEMELKKIVPPDRQLKLCHQFVYHGRAVCSARKPQCDGCPIKEACKQVGVEK